MSMKEQLMDISVDAHFWSGEVKFKISKNDHGNVVVRMDSKHYPSITLYMTDEQFEALRATIGDYCLGEMCEVRL